MNGYKKMFHKIMEFKLKDADTYYNHGSTWIILTDKKQWVIELTKEGVLWYNYYFFQSIFTGLMGFEDTAKNQDYITKWVENFIQNGVKETKPEYLEGDLAMEEVIQNGVKHTEPGGYLGSIEMKGKIVHQLESPKQNEEVEDVIENGIKEVKELPDQSGELRGYGDYYHRQEDRTYPHTKTVNDVICDGVKKINWRKVDSHPTYLDRIIKF
jgi:hypothetical protein